MTTFCLGKQSMTTISRRG